MAAFIHSEEEMSTGSSNSADPDNPHDPRKPEGDYGSPPVSQPIKSPLNWSLSSELEFSETSSLNSSGRLDNAGSQQRHKDQKAVLKYAHLTNEYVRLSEMLSEMDPVQIKENMQRRLVKNDPKAIVAMSILFPRTLFPFVHNMHCVRCHDNFNPRAEGDSPPCQVRHPVGLVITVGSDPEGTVNYYCKGCRQGFKLFRRCYDIDCDVTQTGVCYHGKHTVNPRDVTYRGGVRTCEDRGCVEYYV